MSKPIPSASHFPERDVMKAAVDEAVVLVRGLESPRREQLAAEVAFSRGVEAALQHGVHRVVGTRRACEERIEINARTCTLIGFGSKRILVVRAERDGSTPLAGMAEVLRSQVADVCVVLREDDDLWVVDVEPVDVRTPPGA